ncbi:MAG: BT4734/BF3469 family protein [Flavobacterium sp.]|uniref:BT4734/BF3469 family protein n=1 Tax=Flavobacterium sp. TaxID=239 RepID=UPI002FCA5008
MDAKNEILNLNTSYQINTWSEISGEPTIQTILQEIKSEKHKAQITILREKLKEGNKEYYDNYKKHLPAVTFSATFDSKRTNEKLKIYNSLIVIDIDKLESEQIIENYNCLLNDDHVISFWKSPSNKGYKGLVPIEYIIYSNESDLDKLHKSAFKKLSEYFLDKYNIELDKSGSDITRLCFLSYDVELILKSKFNRFKITDEDLIVLAKSKGNLKTELNYVTTKDKLYNPYNRNDQSNRKIISDIIRHLKNKKASITYSYDEWCKVAMAIANSFTYDVGLNYFLKLSSLDGVKYNEINSTNFLNNCYETRKGDINFNSIVYLANQKGYQTKNQRNAVPKAED